MSPLRITSVMLLVALAATATHARSFPLCLCTLEYAPVCASNGVTFSNECHMVCTDKDLTVVHAGPCRSVAMQKSVQPGCARPCPLYYIVGKFCASDGEQVIDYGNECVMQVAMCEAQSENRELTQVACEANAGKKSSDDCDRPCPEYYIEGKFCASNGEQVVDYGNECIMQVAMCKAQAENLELTQVSCPVTTTTPAPVHCNTFCPLYIIQGQNCAQNPLTGDIQDYGNPCFLNSAICLANNNGMQLIQVDC